MYTQRNLFTVDQCNEFLDLYNKHYNETFRLDWDHETRHQRLMQIIDDVNGEIVSDAILQHHQSICDDLGITSHDPYLLEIFISKYEIHEGVGWHKDRPYYEYHPPFENERVYNFSICLNDDYTGGSLVVDNEVVTTSVGKCTLFPARINHKVAPVESGTRYSLIGWVYKKPLLEAANAV